MIATDTLDLLLEHAIALLAPPPPPRPLLEFATSLRYPDGPAAGEPCDPKSHPAGYEILRAFALGRFDQLVSIGPVQYGKTWATIIVPALYFLVELRRPVVIGWPDRILAAKLWRSKLRPVLAGLGLLPDEGSGSDGGAPEDLLVRGCARLFMLGAGAKNEAGQAGVTAPAVFVDERDSIRPRWVELLFARSAAYDVLARNVSTSTIKDDQRSNTWSVYAASLAYRLWFACPRCRGASHPTGGWQTWEWERVKYDPTDDLTASDSARLVCAHDPSHELTDDERRAALADWRLVARGQTVDGAGVIIGEAPKSLTWGLRWSALDSPMKSLAKLALEHRRAVEHRDAYGDHDRLRQFFRDQLAQPYRDDIEGIEGTTQISAAYLAARSNAHGWAPQAYDRDDLGVYSRHSAPPPAEAIYASAMIDVQQDRCYWSIVAGDVDLRSWDLAWGYEYATAAMEPMSTGDLHRVLDRIAELVPEHLKRDDGTSLAVIARGIDVGYRQDEIIEWLSGHTDWIPVAGAGDDIVGKMRSSPTPGDLLGVVYRRRPEHWKLHGRQQLHLVDVDKVREFAQTGFLRTPGAAGSAHLPRGLKANDAYPKHLIGEVLEEAPKTGKRHWRVVYKRHDYLDLRTYHLALHRLHVEIERRRQTMPRRTYGVIAPIEG